MRLRKPIFLRNCKVISKMRYITSIISTVFFVVAVCALGMQLATYGFAPIAQYVVIAFMFLFVAMMWAADVEAIRANIGADLFYRVLPTNTVFPAIGFAIQCVLAIAYASAWNNNLNSTTLALRNILPQGLFTVLIIELVITTVLVVLWSGNNQANKHTVRLHTQQQAKIAQKEQLKGQILLLKQKIDSSDQVSVNTIRQIEQKINSLPLNLNPNTVIFYQQAMQEIISANQQPGTISAESLQNIKRLVSSIR